MYEFTPFILAIYAPVLLALFFVELLMFWAGCAIADQEPPSWLASFVVVLPVFAVTVVLFEMVCRSETLLRTWGYSVEVPELLQTFGMGLVPLAAVAACLASWLVALILYIPTVTHWSMYKGFWIATSQVVFRGVIVLLIASVGLVFGATYQVNAARPKTDPNAVVKPN